MKPVIIAAAAVLALTACVPVPIVIPLSVGTAPVQTPATRLAATPPSSPRFDGLLNDLRRGRGMPPLVSNAGLDRVAAAHAADQRAGGYLAHRDRRGRDATGRVAAAGVSRCLAGENLGRGQGSAAEVFAQWAASPGHLSNMLNRHYANYGFARSGDVWVLVLLQPC